LYRRSVITICTTCFSLPAVSGDVKCETCALAHPARTTTKPRQRARQRASGADLSTRSTSSSATTTNDGII
jgi:hypothetical protein